MRHGDFWVDTIFGESVWSIGGNGCMNPYPFPIIQLPMEEKDTDSTQHVIRVPHKQAGFLAYGSSYWPRLPRRSCNPRFSEQWWRISLSSQWLYMETIYYWPISFSSPMVFHVAAFVPDHSNGWLAVASHHTFLLPPFEKGAPVCSAETIENQRKGVKDF